MVNARDALAGQRGRLIIETSNLLLDGDYARAHVGVEPGDYVMMAVSDNGCGMDEAVRARIFDPFYTTKERGKGTGLGLATVFGIVKQSGGHVFVESEPGRGSAFLVYLPRSDGPAPPALADPSTTVDVGGSESILLVEDEPLVREFALKALRRGGYHVIEARDGNEAVRVARELRGTIDLLLTDVVMPHMSGPEVAEKLIEMRPGLRVLMMSGYAEKAIGERGMLDGGADFIEKPLSPKALLRKVRAVLDKPR